MIPITQVIIDYILKLILIIVFCFVFPVVVFVLKIFRKKLIEKNWDINLPTYWNYRNEINSYKGGYSQETLTSWNFIGLFFKKFVNVFKKRHDEQEKDIYPMW